MKRFTILAILLTLTLVGCPAPEDSAAVGDGSAAVADPTVTDPADTDPADTGPVVGDPVAEPAGDSASAFQLTPANTLIQFVGVHSDPEKPDPRTGTFEKFSGSAKASGGKLSPVQVDIETASLTTEIEKLTNHLKSGDFFNVNEFPQATFKSTSITDGDDGKVTITGDLTLLGKTNSISFPATVSTADGLAIDAQFTIDRTEFGMDYGVENVKKEVELTIKTPK